jgi:hypothetical protein
MIATTQNRIARQTATEPARRSAGTRSTQSDFQSLLSQATPGAAAATTSGSVPASTTGKTGTGAKASAGSAKASASTAAATGPQPASTTPNTASANPFSRESVEDSMNTWLKGVLQRQNEVRMQLYQNALEGWKNTNARNRELGLPEISAPAAPELAEVTSMPAGYWFRVDS